MGLSRLLALFLVARVVEGVPGLVGALQGGPPSAAEVEADGNWSLKQQL